MADAKRPHLLERAGQSRGTRRLRPRHLRGVAGEPFARAGFGQRGGDGPCLPALLDRGEQRASGPARLAGEHSARRADSAMLGFAPSDADGAQHRLSPQRDPGLVAARAGDAASDDISTHLKRLKQAALAALGVAAATALLATPAAANSQFSSRCGVTGVASASASITYDPFSPSGLSQATISLVLQRNRGDRLERTDDASLILVAPADAPPLTITYQGHNVLYREGNTAGRPRALTTFDFGLLSAGEIRYRFGSLFASDLSHPLDLRVSVPPGTDLSAGEPIWLDILYICTGDGGMPNVFIPRRETRAIRLDVNAVSALQAFYAGSTLDFGEVGDVTTQDVLANPARYTTAATNSLRVRSSGPYEVRVRSQNDFRLTFPGGNSANAAQSIRYRVRFLGQDIASNNAFGTRTCARAGIGGAAGTLPIRAQLAEGGAGKTPSPNYSDVVTVTFTPIIAAAAPQQCAAL